MSVKLIYGQREQIIGSLGWGRGRGGLQTGTRKLLGVMEMFYVLIVVVSWVYAKANTH